jgi:hypothetical protein
MDANFWGSKVLWRFNLERFYTQWHNIRTLYSMDRLLS